MKGYFFWPTFFCLHKNTYCPICNKVHFLEQRKRSTQSIIKDETVDYEEGYFLCPLSNGDENEFVSAGLMDENL